MKKTLFSIAIIVMTAITTQAQQKATKSMFIHLTSGETKEIPCSEVEKVTFGPRTDLPITDEIAVTNTYNIYYGDSWTIDKGTYLICLSDGEITTDGLPTKEGQRIVRLIFMANKSDHYTTAAINPGTYTLSNDSTTNNSIYAKQSFYLNCTGTDSSGELTGNQYLLDAASATIEKKSDGNYKITATVTIEDEYTETYRFTYEGKLAFENGDPKVYTPLTHDVEPKDVNASGRYSYHESTTNYSIAFYNCPIDKDGFVIGAGDIVNVEIFAPYDAAKDFSKLAGTYKPVSLSDDLAPGTFMEGTWYPIYGSYYTGIGTYYTHFNDEGSNECFGLITEGTITISVNGDEFTLILDGTTPEGKKVKLSATANKSTLADYTDTSSQSPSKVPHKFKGSRPNISDYTGHTPHFVKVQ